MTTDEFALLSSLPIPLDRLLWILPHPVPIRVGIAKYVHGLTEPLVSRFANQLDAFLLVIQIGISVEVAATQKPHCFGRPLLGCCFPVGQSSLGLLLENWVLEFVRRSNSRTLFTSSSIVGC